MNENKKKIVIFSGAGLDRESGVLTFRDCKDGLWNNHKIEDVATASAWKKDREKVLNFYNERRQQLPDVKPNKAHSLLVELENHFDVTHVTQNVSDLLERAGATNVYHLHGELTKARGCAETSSPFPKNHSIVDIGYNDIVIGDKCTETDSQLRPHIVWFEEYPFFVNESYKAIGDADILVIVGTSLQIGYTLQMLGSVSDECEVVFIDPDPSTFLSDHGIEVEYIKEKAVKGVRILTDRLLNGK